MTIPRQVQPKQDTLPVQKLSGAAEAMRRQVSAVPFSSGFEWSGAFVIGANQVPNKLGKTDIRYLVMCSLGQSPDFYLFGASKDLITFASNVNIPKVTLWVF